MREAERREENEQIHLGNAKLDVLAFGENSQLKVEGCARS